MTEDGTRDLAWWQIANWAPRTSRILLGALLAGLAGGLVAGLTGALVAAASGFGFEVGLAIALTLGLLGGLSSGFLGGAQAGRFFRSTAGKLMRAGRLRWRAFVSPRVLAGGVVIGLVGGGVTPPLLFDFAAQPMLVLVTGLVAWLALGLLNGIVREVDLSTPVTPLVTWKADQRAHLIVWVIFSLMLALVLVLPIRTLTGPRTIELAILLIFLLIFILLAGLGLGLLSSTTFAARITLVKLAISDSLPLRLMRFLEDAHKREVLRTIGPVYQFRHARLQDRLARWQQIDRPDTRQP